MGESDRRRAYSPPSRPDRSPGCRRSSHRGVSPPRDKLSSRAKSPRPGKSFSPPQRSPSPRTKRLRSAQSERGDEKRPEAERRSGREHDRDHTRRTRDSGDNRDRERDTGTEKRERRSERDESNAKSYRPRHEPSASPHADRHRRSRHRSSSPVPLDSNARARQEVSNTRRSQEVDAISDSVAKMEAAEKALEEKQKQKPTFELSGKLADETNRVRGVTLLFTEPPDACKPNIRWRLYVFKGGEVLNEPLYIHRQSCYLFGRERRVADVPTDHPSCSKQHAVIQFRQVEKEQPDGTLSRQIRPYLMDLGSTNKTFLNDNPIEPQRYYELFEKDTIKFGNSRYAITNCNHTLVNP